MAWIDPQPRIQDTAPNRADDLEPRQGAFEGQFHDRPRDTALPPGRKKLEFADTRSFTEELETCCVDA